MLLTTLLLATSALCCGFPVPDSTPVSVSVACEQVRSFVFKTEPKTNPETRVNLEEITTAEVREKIGAQIFRARDGHLAGRCYLLDRGSVVPLNVGVGSAGIESMVVADLDQNGAFELYYTYSNGSGRSFAHVAFYESVAQRLAVDFQAKTGVLRTTEIEQLGWLRLKRVDGHVEVHGRAMSAAAGASGEFRRLGQLRATAPAKPSDAQRGAGKSGDGKSGAGKSGAGKSADAAAVDLATRPTIVVTLAADAAPAPRRIEQFTGTLVKVEKCEDGTHEAVFRYSARRYRIKDAAVAATAIEILANATSERGVKVAATLDVTGFPRTKSRSTLAGPGVLILSIAPVAP